MGLLTFAFNVTLDGCCDHREMVADDEMLRYWTRVMDAAGAMLFGRRTYELMEDAWPQVARDPKATLLTGTGRVSSTSVTVITTHRNSAVQNESR
jgi:dihydrofolate reductase